MSEDAHACLGSAVSDSGLLDQMMSRDPVSFARLLSVVAEKHAICTRLQVWTDISRCAHRIAVPVASNTFSDVLDAVSRRTAVSQEDILGRKRIDHIAFARQLAMQLYREITGASLEAVGARFSRDHGTVLFAEKKVRNRYDTCAEERKIVNNARSDLRLKPWAEFATKLP